MKTFRLVVSTSTIYDVKAESEEIATQKLKEKLERENPREIYDIKIAEERNDEN